jgi:transposase InsO family protein
MNLENDFNIIYNLKKIGRIMRKYSIICPHRKPNKYKQITKATKEHSTLPNTLNREFKQGIPMKVMLIDISYLAYGNGQRVYLSVIKDGATNKILVYEVLDNLKLKKCKDLNAVKKEMKKFMNYYNNHRYQWNLKKMTPVEYRNHLLNA